MNNKKSTKRALLTSLLSMVLCLTMLIGTTFAWFTDEAKTGVNTIQSGTLDVDIQNAEGTSLANGTLNFVDKNGNTTVLWEPGVTFKTEEFYIVNNGNLDLKYKVVLNGLDGDSELLEVIDFTVETVGDATEVGTDVGLMAGSKSEALVIKGHMDEKAGNEYQNKTLSGVSITVFATQLASEYDSYNNTYDANATYSDDTTQPGGPSDPSLPTAAVTITGEKTVPSLDISDMSDLKVGEDLKLDFSYSYKATQTLAEAADYADWDADFRLTLSRDMVEGEAYIAGQYDGWADAWLPEDQKDLDDNWIQLTADLEGNAPVRLLEAAGIGVTYEELINYNTTFNCGGYATENLTEDLTITVDLILTNGTDTIVLDTRSHTFEK